MFGPRPGVKDPSPEKEIPRGKHQNTNSLFSKLVANSFKLHVLLLIAQLNFRYYQTNKREEAKDSPHAARIN